MAIPLEPRTTQYITQVLPSAWAKTLGVYSTEAGQPPKNWACWTLAELRWGREGSAYLHADAAVGQGKGLAARAHGRLVLIRPRCTGAADRMPAIQYNCSMTHILSLGVILQ